MRTILRLLRTHGYWAQPNVAFRRHKSIIAVIIYLLYFIVPGVVFICYRTGNIRKTMGSIIELIIFLKIVLQLIIVIYYHPMVEQMYEDVQSALASVSKDPHRDVQAMLEHLERSSEWLAKGYLGVEMSFTSFYCLFPIVSVLVKYASTGVLPPLNGILESDALLFDHVSHFWIWLPAALLVTVIVVSVVLTTVALDSFFWCLLHHISCLFKIIEMKITRLDKNKDTQRLREQIGEIRQLQEIAYGCVASFEKILNGLMLFLYGACMVAICMTMTMLTVINDDKAILVRMVIVLNYFTYQILSFSLLGTELTTASTSIAEALYAIRWYDFSVADQRRLLFMLMRAQKMAALTTGKFFLVNRETFGKALKTTFSTFTVMRQFYGNQ